jgi:hypothetical protein
VPLTAEPTHGAGTATRSRFTSPWGLNLAILVIGGLIGLQVHGREVPIDSYRLDAGGRLVVTASSGDWYRIAEIEERNDAVAVTIRAAQAPLPGADIPNPAELVVPLREPLGDRVVIDGHVGAPVPP